MTYSNPKSQILVGLAVFFALSIIPLLSFALDFSHTHVVAQLGGFTSTQGQSQFVGINDAIGDDFTVTHRHSNVLVGLGYYLDALDKGRLHLAYGIDAFYLPKTSVGGAVIQEKLFTNSTYHYNITHLPIYAALKASLNNSTNKYAVTFDGGIGPNIIQTSGFREHPIYAITLPDDAFSGHTSVVFSAMAGAGLKINEVFGKASFELGYRFFYLGQGQLKTNTNQLLNTLKSGHDYANAIVCAVTF